MFTGIIEAVGTLAVLQRSGADARMRVRTGGLDLGGTQLGDSIAVNGVCLTVTELPGDGFWADVSAETLTHTTLGALAVGAALNLERALTLQSRLGGHLVSGHVDGVGELIERNEDGRSVRLTVRAPAELAKYIAAKGSIGIDGISLTVNAVQGATFSVNAVPHTLARTTLHAMRPGGRCNLEVDIIARYLERLLQNGATPPADAPSQLSADFLRQHGFA